MSAGISALLETFFFLNFHWRALSWVFSVSSSLAATTGLLYLVQWCKVKKSALSFRGVQAGMTCSGFDVVYSQLEILIGLVCLDQ